MVFVTHHNLALLSSDHATKLFSNDSKVAKNFACGHTKCTAIIKEGLAPYYTANLKKKLINPFSVMIDELNDKTDKSCIILARILDPEIGDIRTRFVDMPVMSFMSDTTNVMKGTRSGVQKLIRQKPTCL